MTAFSSMPSAAASPTGPDHPCNPLSPSSCQTGGAAAGQDAQGWLYVAGRVAEARESASRPDGCAGCRWIISTVCLTQSGQAGPGGQHCTGIYVTCPGADIRVRVQFGATTESVPVDIDTYCYATPDGGIVDAATVMPRVRSYAETVAVTKPSIRAWPPGGSTLIGLQTFFAATAGRPAAATVGGEGYSLQLQVGAATYAWSFGDGAALGTTDEGGPPPTGPVQHAYSKAGSDNVTAIVSYDATYTVVTPYGSFGPQAVTGGPVRTLPAELTLHVREAHAGLTG
jgi:hypothetical protein